MENRTDNYDYRIGSTDILIKIRFRQHASWQGEIQWLESKKSKTLFFRSLLELILLIQEAVEAEDRIEASYHFRTWEDSVSKEIKDAF